MLSLLFLLLVLQEHASEALPLYARAPESPDGRKLRTLSTIVSGCLSTTFVCSWVSIAPNVPPTSSKYDLKSLLRKLRIIFWAIVIPELILSWSVRQWYAAGKLAVTYNRRIEDPEKEIADSTNGMIRKFFSGVIIKREKKTDWRRAHGHFVAMGGIIIVRRVHEKKDIPDTPTSSRSDDHNPTRAVLNYQMLKELVKDPTFSISITEKEIEDKAKGDFLSKTIATLQVLWFIIQVILRFHQHLAVTELEIVTLALASMNGLMYFFWWSKPLGVMIPMEIHIENRDLDMSIGTGGKQDGRTFYKIVTLQIPNLFRDLKRKVDRIFRNEDRHHPLLCWLILLPAYLLALIFSPLIIPSALIFASLFDVMATNAIPANVTHVPTFYYPDIDGQERIGTITLPFSAFIFGGIHCIGWNLPYQSHADRMIWRICAASITASPPLCALLWGLTTILTWKSHCPGRFAKIKKTIDFMVKMTSFTISIALASGYVIARLTLLVQACVLLRRQPDSAFFTLDLDRYMPHF